jgi:hypothetical protein
METKFASLSRIISCKARWSTAQGSPTVQIQPPRCPKMVTLQIQSFYQHPFTRKMPPQDDGEIWMSWSQGSTPAEGRKKEEDSKSLA